MLSRRSTCSPHRAFGARARGRLQAETQLWPRFRPHNGCFIKYSELALEAPSRRCCSPSVSQPLMGWLFGEAALGLLWLLLSETGVSPPLLSLRFWMSFTLLLKPFSQRKRLQTPPILLTFVRLTPGFGKHPDKQGTLLFSSPPWQKCREARVRRTADFTAV